MGDVPGTAVSPLHINSLTQFMSGREIHAHGGFANAASFNWIGANTAAYIPLALPWSYPVKRAFWVNGTTVTGQADIGIYTLDGLLIWHSGSTAQSGASALQYVTVTPDLILPAGRYYMGFTLNGTTSLAFGIATALTAIMGRLVGLYQQATALPLPASATFAQWASIGFPIVGITRTSTGF